MINLSDELLQKIKSFSLLENLEEHIASLKGFWQMLQCDESALIELMNNKAQTVKGNAEHGPVLYMLNHNVSLPVQFILKRLGMPSSQIPKQDWANWMKSITNGPGVVTADGTIFLESLYAGLDPKWFEALVDYIFFKVYKKGVAHFGTSPAKYAVASQDQLSIAIVGDWGTGNYDDSGFPSPSSLVGKAISALKPDITIHLGDVYYAGKASEETTKLLTAFPAGKLASFTLNSNHEMYDGANGYFNTALANPVFVKQQGSSYFAVVFKDWVIIGLDTAYYDKSSLYMDGVLNDANQQLFIKSLGITAAQKVIVMCHHVGIQLDGQSVNDPLFTQVYTALGRYPDYWYYGHLHNGIVYNDASITKNYKCPSGAHPQLRCIGNGAIPYGKAKGLQDATGKIIPGISYFAHTPMPNPSHIPLIQLRVLNGFAMITLQQGTISEKVYEVSASATTVAWQSSPVSAANAQDVKRPLAV